MIETLAWVTARKARGLDEDEAPVVAALQRAGVAVEVLDWDDPGVDWSRFERAVLRSAWDYADRLPEFLSWTERVGVMTDLVNPPDMVRWNLDKRYLAELAEAGLPIIPTEFVLPGASPTFPAGRFVVKPAVGAGSRDAAWYEPEERETGLAHVARLHEAGKVVLVQPFLSSVPVDGEWPLVFFAGRFSHAAGKRVALPQAGPVDELFAAETSTVHAASPEQVQLAQAVVDLVTARFGTPVYARVDIVRDDAGRYCVLEVELVEPSLFLRYAEPDAVDLLVAALIR